MFTLEEYILKRKKEDGINECDLGKRTENTRICVNYVFEYFNNYLDTKPADEKTILHENKIEKYSNIIKKYDPYIQEWLTSLYSSYGKYMHKNLSNYIEDTYFLLYDTEAEFRSLSYDIYPKIIKKFKFLDNQSENIFLFIKDEHRVENLFSPYDKYHICDNIDEWIDETYRKYGVNLYNFCCSWVHNFFNDPDIWPTHHKKKSNDYDEYSKDSKWKIPKSFLWDYDYTQKSNLFGLDSLYRNMPKKSFTKGKKQEFEMLLLYCWLHQIESDDEYWDTYLKTVLPKI